MSFLSIKESIKDITVLNAFEKLQNAGNNILSDLLDFPQCCPEIHSEDLYSLDSILKAETDSWSNPKFEASHPIEFRYSCDDSVDGSSNGSTLTCFSLPDESNFRDSILPPYDVSISDDFHHSLAMNSSTIDVLDILEDTGSSFSTASKSSSHCNTYLEHGALFLRTECFGEVDTDSEHLEKSKLFYSPTRSGPSMSSINWSIDNTQLECALITEPCNAFEISETFDQNETVDKLDTVFECNEACWSLRKSQQEKKDLSDEQFSCGGATTYTVSMPENIFMRSLKVKKTASLLNTSNFQMTSADSSHDWYINENMNITEISGFHMSSLESSLNNSKPVQPENQRKTEQASFGKNTSPLVTTSQQWQKPFSSEIYTDLHNLSSRCPYKKKTLPLCNAACMELDEQKSAKINKSSFPHTQTNRSLNNINRVANKKQKYLKVGKRGCFVIVPAKDVNKHMVRDLLSMSGNKKEISVKDSTQEYRENIRKMLQQKRMRLNIV